MLAHREEKVLLPEASEWKSLLQSIYIYTYILAHGYVLPDFKIDIFFFFFKDQLLYGSVCNSTYFFEVI